MRKRILFTTGTILILASIFQFNNAYAIFSKQCHWNAPEPKEVVEMVIILVEFDKGMIDQRTYVEGGDESSITLPDNHFSWASPQALKSFFHEKLHVGPLRYSISDSLQQNTYGRLSLADFWLTDPDSEDGWYEISPDRNGNENFGFYKKIFAMAGEDYDFSNYDLDNNGYIDNVTIIFGGSVPGGNEEREESNSEFLMWYEKTYGFDLLELKTTFKGLNVGGGENPPLVDGIRINGATIEYVGPTPELTHGMHEFHEFDYTIGFSINYGLGGRDHDDLNLCHNLDRMYSVVRMPLGIQMYEAFPAEEVVVSTTDIPVEYSFTLHPSFMSKQAGWDSIAGENKQLFLKIMMRENPDEYLFIVNNNHDPNPEYDDINDDMYNDFDANELVYAKSMWGQGNDLIIAHVLDQKDGTYPEMLKIIHADGTTSENRRYYKSDILSSTKDFSVFGNQYLNQCGISFPYDPGDSAQKDECCNVCYRVNPNEWTPAGCDTLARGQGETVPESPENGYYIPYNCGLGLDVPINELNEIINVGRLNTRKFKSNNENGGNASGIIIKNIIKNETDRTISFDVSIDPPPSPPSNVMFSESSENMIQWDKNTESDIYGYRIYEMPQCKLAFLEDGNEPADFMSPVDEILNTDAAEFTLRTEFMNSVDQVQGCLFVTAIDTIKPDHGVHHESKPAIVYYPKSHTVNITLQPGWNMVGISGTPTQGSDAEGIFGTNQIYEYTNSGFSKEIEHVSDSGFSFSHQGVYWIHTDETTPTDISLEFLEPQCQRFGWCSKDFPIPTNEWTRVLNPFIDIDLPNKDNNIQIGLITGEYASPGDVLNWNSFITNFGGSTFVFNPQSHDYDKHSIADTLLTYKRWEPQFIYCYECDIYSILYDYPATVPGAPKESGGTEELIANSTPMWGLSLILYDGNSYRLANLGMGQNYSDGIDPKDRTVSNPGSNPKFNFPHVEASEWNGPLGNYSDDYREMIAEGETKTWVMKAQTFSPGKNPTLQITNVARPLDYQTTVTDISTGKVYEIAAGEDGLILLDGAEGERTFEISVFNPSPVIQPAPETPVARVSAKAVSGYGPVSGSPGDVIEVDFRAYAAGVTDAGVTVGFDAGVLRPCNWNDDAPPVCVVVGDGLSVDVADTVAGMLVFGSAVNGGTMKLHVVSVDPAADFGNSVDLGRISFAVLPGADSKATKISVVPDDPELLVVGKIDGKATNDYDIEVGSVTFTGSGYTDTTPPVVKLVSAQPGEDVFAPGGTYEVRYSVTDNVSGACDVTVTGWDFTRGKGAQGIGGVFAGVDCNGAEQVFAWDGRVCAGAVCDAALDGIYQINITAKDDANRTSSVAVTYVTVDGAGPSISNAKPLPGTDAQTTAPDVSVRVADGANGAGVDGRVCGAQELFPADCGLLMTVDGARVDAAWNSGTGRLSYAAFFENGDYTHEARVKAADLLGNVSEFEWSFITTPGTIFLKLEGKYVRGNVLVEVIAVDNPEGAGIERVELFVDDALAGAQSTPAGNYYVIWTSGDLDAGGARKYPDGEHSLYAVAYDYMGNSRRSAAVTVVLDNTPPALADAGPSNEGFYSPTGNSDIKTVSFAPQVTEENEYEVTVEVGLGMKESLVWIEYFSSTVSVPKGGEGAGAFTWDGTDDTGALAGDGTYRYYITVKDIVGLEAMQTGTLLGDSNPPSVALENPEDGDIVPSAAEPENRTVDFRARATEEFGESGVAGVRLYRLTKGEGGAVVEEELTGVPPTILYTYGWETAENGDDDGIYLLSVKATDRAGNYSQWPEPPAEGVELIVANKPLSIANARSAPLEFSPMQPPGNSPRKTTSVFFTLFINPALVGIIDATWNVKIEPKAGGAVINLVEATLDLNQRQYDLGPIMWDGNNGGTSIVEDGEYSCRVTAVATNNYTVTKSCGTLLVDSTLPVLSDAAATPDFFNPDGNGTTDTTKISAQVVEDNSYNVRFDISGNGYSYVEEKEYPAGLDSDVVSITWNGKAVNAAGDIELVPDGNYIYTINVEDVAKNWTPAAQGIVVKDNPPVITLENAMAAFSPNGIGPADFETAKVGWSAGEEGIFNIKVYEKEKAPRGSIADIGQPDIVHGSVVGAVRTDAWSGRDENGVAYPEGRYWMEINGVDADSKDIDGNPVVNPCVPVQAKVILDITAPEITRFYPYIDEFTPLNPKFKINVTDKLAGFGEDSSWAQEYTVINVGPGGLAFSPGAKMYGDLFFRAMVRPANNLTTGPHTLSATTMDLAGNVGTLNSFRFVAIPALEDEFTEADEQWISSAIFGETPGTIAIQDGKITLSHMNTKADKDGHPEIDKYGSGIIGKGVYDVSRPEVNIEARVVSLEGEGDVFRTGIAIGEPLKKMVSWVIQGNPEGLLSAVAYVAQGGTYSGAIPYFEIISGLPVDLKIVYEEGRAEFYLNGSKRASYEIELGNTITGIFADSGFYESDESSFSSVNAEIEYFNTDLAAPIVKEVVVENESNEDAYTLAPGSDSYKLRVIGTPWQVDVEGRLMNPDAITGISPWQLANATVGDTQLLAPMAADSEIYESEYISLDNVFTADGVPSRRVVPIGNNGIYYELPAVGINLVSGIHEIVAEYDAVELITLENIEYPRGYRYIEQGDRYRITAETRPGDWVIEALLLDIDMIEVDENERLDYSNAIISEPLKMTKVQDGRYEIVGTLSGISQEITAIMALVRYGTIMDETGFSEEALYIGKPQIQFATLSNADRLGVDTIKVGETLSINAKGEESHSYIAVICNYEYPDQEFDFNRAVGNPVNLSDPDGTGDYTGSMDLKSDIDLSWNNLVDLRAIIIEVVNGSPEIRAESWNSLHVDIDRVYPQAPLNPVLLSGPFDLPVAGDTIESKITWTIPAYNSDGSEIDDLRGFNIYRTGFVDAQGSFSVSPGSDPLNLIISDVEGYSLDNTTFSFDSKDYNISHLEGGVAGWYEKGANNIIPLPLVDSTFIDPGQDIYIYLIQFVFRDYLNNYYGSLSTVYSQESFEEVDRWLNSLIARNIAVYDTGTFNVSRIDGYAKVFIAQEDGAFEPTESIDAMGYYQYEKTNAEPWEHNVYSDGYTYSDKLFSYVVKSVDTAGNESLPSIRAGLPNTSELLLTATFKVINVSDAVKYINLGDQFRIDVETEISDNLILDGYLLNKDAIDSGIAFEHTVVKGPLRLQKIGSSLYRIDNVLDSLFDEFGRASSEVIAVISIVGMKETVTASNILKPSIIDGTIRVDEGVYISGEIIPVEYSVQNISEFRTIGNLKVLIRLMDVFSGETIAESAGETIDVFEPGSFSTGMIQFYSPENLLSSKYYYLELFAVIQGDEDLVDKSVVKVVPEKVIISGEPIPINIIQYQEPMISFVVENQTSSPIMNGIVTGKVLPVGYIDGRALSQFIQPVSIIGINPYETRFTPVNANPGEYNIVLYYQSNQSSTPVMVFTTKIHVESCSQ